MTGLVRRTGRSVRLVRTCLELTVLFTGWSLGGTVGIGTVVFALAIGPLAQIFLPLFDLDAQRQRRYDRRSSVGVVVVRTGEPRREAVDGHLELRVEVDELL
jgi:hypothetical protein